VIFQYGEEPASRKIARYITKARAEAPIERTGQLADIVARAVRGKPGQHPATRTFQALRIYINDELGQLQAGLQAALDVLKPGGKLVVVTFHSLEDRIVKEFMAQESGAQRSVSRYQPAPAAADNNARLTLPQRKAVIPTAAECLANPRARSAKLRCAVRTPFFESMMEIAA
jgi:16S rRNA (cytosine1402-N4)-methyltransferase